MASKVAATTHPANEDQLVRSLAEQLLNRRKALSIREFADLLGLAQTTIYDAARVGELPSIRVGAAIRLDPKACAEWLRKHGG